MNSSDGSGTAAAKPMAKKTPYVLSAIVPAVSAATICFSTGFYAKLFSVSLVIIVLAQFCLFLFGMARDIGQRNLLAVSIFVFVNIASIICLFGNAYRWLGLKDTLINGPPARPLLDAIYFSVVTWTTLGYGDIVPVPDARFVAALEALAGYFVMALFIAVLLEMLKRR
jgi:hypothetical protein